MLKNKQSVVILCTILMISILACNLPVRSQPDTRGTMQAALTEVYATNITNITSEPINLATSQPSLTPELGKTVTANPDTTQITPLSTAASVEQDAFASDLQRRGYELITSSSTIGPKNFVYSAYLFSNTKIDPTVDETNPEICRLAIYRLDEDQNSLLRSFTAPQYPEGAHYNFPVSCEAVNWDSPSANITWGGAIPPEIRKLLGLHGNWSDINQNGLLEFAVYYQYCNQGCIDYGAVAVHFYEIKNTFQLMNITADLPGVIRPWNIIHYTDPLDLWVYELIEYEPNVFIESSWIYAWDGREFEDVTSQHAGEYKVNIDQIVADIQDQYGMTITHTQTDFLEILVLSNKAKLPHEQALGTFLDVTNPAHWPGSDKAMNCWLQLARAYAQRDADANRPFTLPPSPTTINSPGFSDILETIDQTRYAVSACK
ncbi:MAG: hypothetical protein H8D34_06080 [Chloroflexi bacterium]|nr:hypothetical protein [Chloroflexota bacterium]